MIDKIISNLEEKIGTNTCIKDSDKEQLLVLLKGLRTEVSELSKTDREQAESVTTFTQSSTHEAMRERKRDDLLQLSLKGLASSVEELETSHPKLAEIVNRISHVLSNMGI